jgi:coiled-coil domain-containing protein 55
MHAAALAEDASVFDYDSHFDSIQEARAEPKQKEKMARESRYIASLLETAEERKREQDVQYERQLAKERAAEDHLYGDKEKFVTAAYKKKLEEEAKWKAEQKQKQVDEEQNAVEKKGHMGDFYRNILRNNVAFGTATAEKASGSATANKAAMEKERGGAPGKQHHVSDDGDDIMPERRVELEARAAAAGASSRQGQAAAPRQPHSGGGGGDGGGSAMEAGKMDKKREEELLNRKTKEDRKEIPNAEMGAAGKSKKEEETEAAVTVDQAAAAPAAAPANKKNREDAVAAAKERYLARKRKAENLT